MTYIHTDQAPSAIGPYSQAIVHAGLAYVSGQIPLRADGSLVTGNVEMQAEQVFANLKEVLKACNSSLSEVLKVSLYLSDMEDFVKVNTIYAKHFGDHKPARVAMAVKTLPKNVKIEIECISISNG